MSSTRRSRKRSTPSCAGSTAERTRRSCPPRANSSASLSDDPALLGAPEGFTVTVRSVTVSAGAGFLVALTGSVLTMPGLPKVPAAENIDVDDDGRITGLF